MDFLLENESFENKIALLSLRKRLNYPANPKVLTDKQLARQLIENHMLAKRFPPNIDSDIVMGLSDEMIEKECFITIDSSAEDISKASFILQRFVQISTTIPEGKLALTQVFGNLDVMVKKENPAPKNTAQANRTHVYILKTKQDLVLKNDEGIDTLHEAIVAFCALNNLRNITLAFAATLAVFRCSDYVGTSWCTNISSMYKYTVMENVEGVPLSSIYLSLTKNETYIILYQLAGSLQLAYNMYEFKHNDLHRNNVMIYRSAKEREVYVGNGQYIKTNLILRIIDFGYSEIEGLNVKGFLAILSDLFRIISSCAIYAINNDNAFTETFRYFDKDTPINIADIQKKYPSYALKKSDNRNTFEDFLLYLNVLYPLPKKYSLNREMNKKVLTKEKFPKLKPVLVETDPFYYLFRQRYVESLTNCENTYTLKKFQNIEGLMANIKKVMKELKASVSVNEIKTVLTARGLENCGKLVLNSTGQIKILKELDLLCTLAEQKIYQIAINQ